MTQWTKVIDTKSSELPSNPGTNFLFNFTIIGQNTGS